jgi:hypothetical protein
MNFQSIELGGVIRLNAPSSWQDITREEEGVGPLTLADLDAGVGALQISPALYRSGLLPRPSEHELLSLVREFGQQRNLGGAEDESTFTETSLKGAGASFHSGDDFIRVWYVSDGSSFALVTYVCNWGQQGHELPICAKIVRSIRFTGSGS